MAIRGEPLVAAGLAVFPSPVSLPNLIEIQPLTGPLTADIAVPGSKSITNRALILAALGGGITTLRGALWSEDTQNMVAGLRRLGFEVSVVPDPQEPCNRTISVTGAGGRIPNAGTRDAPLELFVGNAGTAARFLSALVCLGHGAYRLHGDPRMHQRPQRALFEALRTLGYRVDAASDRLPAVIHGAGPRGGRCRVSLEESSQFASALLLCSEAGDWEIEVEGADSEDASYVGMTREMLALFPRSGGEFRVEPDASSGSYFWAADWLLWWHRIHPELNRVRVRHWPASGWQVDQAYPRFRLQNRPISRRQDLGDSIMTAIVMASLRFGPDPGAGSTGDDAAEPPDSLEFRDLGRLRVQECERVVALRTELQKCGARVEEEGDTLRVTPLPAADLRGGVIETYEDHRIAMCFAILGLKVAGMRIQNPACVKKTFPNFFVKLAADPPGGLGVRIHDAATGGLLRGDDLFAG